MVEEKQVNVNETEYNRLKLIEEIFMLDARINTLNMEKEHRVKELNMLMNTKLNELKGNAT